MTLREIQSDFVNDIKELIQFTYQEGYELTFGEVLRTEYQQKEYLRTGLSKTMDSMHLKKLAVDFNVFKDGKLLDDVEDIRPIGEYWKRLNPDNVWGGDWGWDAGHFERKP